MQIITNTVWGTCMKHVFLLIALLIAGTAYAIDVPESVITNGLQDKFPIVKGDFELTNPQISLLDGKGLFCAVAKPKSAKSGIDFCATFIPKWRKDSATLHISKPNITSLKMPGVADSELDWTKKLLNKVVMPQLENFQLYKADNFIGKQVTSVKVKLGYLDVSFW